MSVPKRGQYGEPWHTDEPYCIYIWSRDQEMLADLPVPDGEDAYLARMRGVGRGATRDEQRAIAQRILASVNALDGRDPEALHELEAAARAAERVMSCVSDAEKETRAALRLRAALKAFGVWS